MNSVAATAGSSAASYFGQSSRSEYVFSTDPAGRTYLSRQLVPYPFHICRLHYVDQDPPGMATLYVQSCSAGLLQHDDLQTSVIAQDDAKIHFTTAAQTIVHSMDEGEAKQKIRIEAFPGTLVEYLPESLILFPQSRLRSSIHITAHEGSSVVACEWFLLHDYSGGDRMFDRLESDLRVDRPNGDLLALDRFHVTGDVLKKSLPGVNGAYRAQGSFLVVSEQQAPESTVSVIRRALAQVPGIYAGASILRNKSGAWTRILAPDGLALRSAMLAAWTATREVLTNLRPLPRRK
jgi:urease accessory protein